MVKRKKKAKLPRMVKRVKYQRGKSNTKADKKRRAMPSGLRRSKTGNLYWETRKNRTDKKNRI